MAPREMNLITLLAAWKRHINMIAKSYSIATPLWQTSFYDHGVRNEEGLKLTMEYILNNPVRSGLCTRWDKYPYSYLGDY
jgi:hypothetical protein